MPEKFNIVRQCRHGLMVFNRHDQFIGKALNIQKVNTMFLAR